MKKTKKRNAANNQKKKKTIWILPPPLNLVFDFLLLLKQEDFYCRGQLLSLLRWVGAADLPWGSLRCSIFRNYSCSSSRPDSLPIRSSPALMDFIVDDELHKCNGNTWLTLRLISPPKGRGFTAPFDKDSAYKVRIISPYLIRLKPRPFMGRGNWLETADRNYVLYR